MTTEQCLAALNEARRAVLGLSHGCRGLADPQIAHRGALAEVEDGGGTFRVLNLPFRMSGAKVCGGQADLDTGRAHASRYLKETGLSEDEIAAFSGKPLTAELR